MTLPGNAFLAIWHDIEPSAQTEYMEWHTREHMPERVSVPGFTCGKRLINHGFTRYQYGTVYGGEDVDVFRSAAYLERLNSPTPWTNVVQPSFRNFLRIACEKIKSVGSGEGGAMATIRLDFGENGTAEALRRHAPQLAEGLYDVAGVCGVHVGLARPEVTSVKTKESEMRPEMAEKGFDAVVLLEGSGVPELETFLPQMLDQIANCDCSLINPASLIYSLAYSLTEADL